MVTYPRSANYSSVARVVWSKARGSSPWTTGSVQQSMAGHFAPPGFWGSVGTREYHHVVQLDKESSYAPIVGNSSDSKTRISKSTFDSVAGSGPIMACICLNICARRFCHCSMDVTSCDCPESSTQFSKLKVIRIDRWGSDERHRQQE